MIVIFTSHKLLSRNYKKVPLILLLQIQILLLSVFLTGKENYLNKINSFCKLSGVSVGDASFKVVCFVPKNSKQHCDDQTY